eukprot:2760938-Pyramimonas_sp.AAC.1
MEDDDETIPRTLVGMMLMEHHQTLSSVLSSADLQAYSKVLILLITGRRASHNEQENAPMLAIDKGRQGR